MFENSLNQPQSVENTNTKNSNDTQDSYVSKKLAYRQYAEAKQANKELTEAQKAEFARRESMKREKKRLEVNHNYVDQQAAKRANETYEIKEVNDLSKAESVFKDKIKNVLEMNDILPDSIIANQIISNFKTDRFGEVNYNDIKNHEIIKAYYQIEQLNKYMTKQDKN